MPAGGDGEGERDRAEDPGGGESGAERQHPQEPAIPPGTRSRALSAHPPSRGVADECEDEHRGGQAGDRVGDEEQAQVDAAHQGCQCACRHSGDGHRGSIEPVRLRPPLDLDRLRDQCL
ncbi:hypothetical protein OG984_17970 [Nocardioides sp. NBC_00368]